jgi:putative serine protease PepD
MKTKFSILLIILLLFGFATTSSAQEEVLADFNKGAVELINKCLPGLVMIYTGGGGGSGFIVDREGYIFTNYHVAGGNSVVEVRTLDHQAYTAVNVGNDASIDFTLLKILDPPDDLQPMALADSDKIKPGDICMSMGAPGGSSGNVDWDDPIAGWLDSNTCDLGVVNEVQSFQESLWTSGIGLSGMAPGYGSNITYMFDLDAEINGGNSGGPTVNAKGEVIGINTYGGSTGSRYFESSNQCVPINHHAKAARNIINYGHPRWPYLGVDILPRKFNNKGIDMTIMGEIINPFEDALLKEGEEGHLVRFVSEDSPAYEAGLRSGDIILTFNRKKYRNPLDICKTILMDLEVGDEVTLAVKRGDTVFPAVKISLGEKYIRNDQEININGIIRTRETY